MMINKKIHMINFHKKILIFKKIIKKLNIFVKLNSRKIKIWNSNYIKIMKNFKYKIKKIKI